MNDAIAGAAEASWAGSAAADDAAAAGGSPLAPERGPHVWRPARIDPRRDGSRRLGAPAVDEIRRALDHLRRQGPLDLPAITRVTFPLPTLGPHLARLGGALRRGRGFVVLRGLDPTRFDPDDLARIHVGLGVYIGRAIPQSHQGELLGNVMSIGDLEDRGRGYTAGGRLGPHTDNCDVIGLMCLRPAGAGGTSEVISAGAVHNRILAERPDLLQVLYDGFLFRRPALDAERGSGVAVRRIAIFSRAGGPLSVSMTLGYLRAAVHAGDAVLTPIQEEAVSYLSEVVRDPALRLRMNLRAGDIQYLDNRRMLHGRTDYRDPPEIARRRHFLRLWLMIDGWPPLPDDQGVHRADDHAGWLRHRRPLMELPSRHVAEMTRRKADLAS
ncbi:MAG: TauD/TfdA family dioxygenase [Alphaproteobacteria bacterium]